MTNEDKQKKIADNKEIIVKLLNENIDLAYDIKLSKAKRIEETTANLGTKKKPEIFPVKKIFWDEIFKDEDTGEEMKIERMQVIEINGKKTNHGMIIKYYDINSI